MRHIWWIRRRIALAVMVLCLMYADAVAAQGRGATITISQPADATTMDPGRSTQVLTVNYFANLYDTLTRWDSSLKLQPGLAVAWKNVNDTTWEVTLRSGVKFHDGSPLTAEDVKAVYDRNLVPGKTVVQAGFATIEAVQVLNPTTLRIVTKKPDPLIPVRMAQMGGYIYPGRLATGGSRNWPASPSGPARTASCPGPRTTSLSWTPTANGGAGAARPPPSSAWFGSPSPTTSRACPRSSAARST